MPSPVCEPSAFRIFDDKAEQTLVQFAREDAPISVGIVLDLSGSMQDKLSKSREAVDQFLQCAKLPRMNSSWWNSPTAPG